MKIICSLNGIDGVGKTTQSNMLEKKYPDLVEAFYGLENYEGFPKKSGKELHSWWFKESTIEEFCDAMYLSLKNRNDEIMKSNRNIIVIDKGIENFEARIKATLRVRGFAHEEIEKNINKSKEKCEFRDIENVKILINKRTMNKDKVQTNSYNKKQIDLYQYYQNEQIMEIIKQQEKFDVSIDYNLGIEKINEQIKRYLISKIIEMKDNSKIDIRNDFIYRGNSIKYINFDCIDGNDDFRKIYNLLFNIEKLGYVQIYNCKYYVEKYENTEKYKKTLLDRAQSNLKINKEIPIKKLADYKIPMFYKKILIDFISEMQKYYNEKYYCMGRNDFQIKLNGHRIELEDIEKNLMLINEIQAAVVIPNNEKNSVFAFVKSKESKTSETEIKENLRNRLVEYMIPKRIFIVNEMPLTFNKKIDKKALLDKYVYKKEEDTKKKETSKNQIIEIWNNIIGEKIELNKPYSEYMIDSLTLTKLSISMEKIWKDFSIEDIIKYKTLNNIIKHKNENIIINKTESRRIDKILKKYKISLKDVKIQKINEIEKMMLNFYFLNPKSSIFQDCYIFEICKKLDTKEIKYEFITETNKLNYLKSKYIFGQNIKIQSEAFKDIIKYEHLIIHNASELEK